MFQKIFQQQPESLFVWPMLGLVLFLAAFTLQVVVILTTQKKRHDQSADLPFSDSVADVLDKEICND